MVDIFARQNGGARNGEVKIKNGEIETHSVVLYKDPAQDLTERADTTQKQTISVIDPSNFLFSSHLSNYQSGVPGVVLKTFHKSIQIYKPLTATGPNFDQYRDCIDCAVKIALGLNASAIYYNFTDQKSIIDCSVIQYVSNNQQNLDKNIIFPDLPVRIKQTSNSSLVNKFCELQKAVNQKLDALNFFGRELTAVEVTTHCRKTFESKVEPQQILTEIAIQNKTCITSLEECIQLMKEEHVQLFGDLVPLES